MLDEYSQTRAIWGSACHSGSRRDAPSSQVRDNYEEINILETKYGRSSVAWCKFGLDLGHFGGPRGDRGPFWDGFGHPGSSREALRRVGTEIHGVTRVRGLTRDKDPARTGIWGGAPNVAEPCAQSKYHTTQFHSHRIPASSKAMPGMTESARNECGALMI